MAFVRQTNFSTGELSPFLHGRTDLEKHAFGLRSCRNFFLDRRSGAAVSRPGSLFIGYTGARGLDFNARLIPFVYSDTQSYVVEFTDGLIRFLSSGGIVLNGGVPYFLISPYLDAELKDIRFVQSGDVLTLTHPNHPPRELTRLGHTNWTLSPVVFATLQPWFTDIDAPANVTQKPMAVLSAPDFYFWQTALAADPVNAVFKQAPNVATDAGHPAREWTLKVTALVQDTASGRSFETLPVTIDRVFDGVHGDTTAALPSNNNIVVGPDRPLTLRRSPTAGLLTAPPGYTSYKVLAYLYYAGRGDLFGLIGTTKTRDFVWLGDTPNYLVQPPRGTNPFEVYNNGGALARTETPTAVAYFQERRVFAGTPQRPGFVFASATGAYTNFDEHVLQLAGEALIFEIASRRREEGMHLVQLQKLIELTKSSAWSIAGVQGSPLDFDSMDVRLEDEVGANFMRPLVIDGMCFYARAKGTGVRSLTFDGRSGSFAPADASYYSSHLFLGQRTDVDVRMGGPIVKLTLRDWTYAEDPWGVVWAAREDGVLLSFTPSGDGGGGWARHDTDGSVRSVCAIPEGDEDAVYMVVARQLNGGVSTCLERMTSRVQRNSELDDGCVDCGVIYNGPPVTAIGGLAHLEGKQVYVVGVGNSVVGPLVVAAASIALPEEPKPNAPGGLVVLYIGLLYTPELELLDIASTELRGRQKNVTRVFLEVVGSRGLWAGSDFQNLEEWQQRTVADGYSAPSAATDLVDVPINSAYDRHGRACLRQTLPLPTTVVGVTREVDVGGS